MGLSDEKAALVIGSTPARGTRGRQLSIGGARFTSWLIRQAVAPRSSVTTSRLWTTRRGVRCSMRPCWIGGT
jgi:hypothetical protein